MPVKDYFNKVREILERILSEEEGNINKAAEIIANAIERNNLVHVLGTGHSMIIAEELFMRAGGLAPVNAILDDRISIRRGVGSGLNERKSGLAEKILEKYNIQEGDVFIVVSVSGINAVPVEAAITAKNLGCKVIALTSVKASKELRPRNPYGKRLFEVADVTIDTKVPLGDAVIELPQLNIKAIPISTITGAFAANSIVLRAIEILIERGVSPKIWVSSNVPDSDKRNMRYVEEFLGRLMHLGVEELLRELRKEEEEIKAEAIEAEVIALRGVIVTPYRMIKDGLVIIRGTKIAYVGDYEEEMIPNGALKLDFSGHYVIPGLIDIHIHGCEGENAFDASKESLKNLAIKLAKHGVTSFLPTAIALPEEHLIQIIKAVKEVIKSKVVGAKILGLNLEGPFVNPEKRGALIVGYMKKASIDMAKRILKEGEGLIKIMTIAPELPGALEVIRWLTMNDVIVSIGHTNANYDEAMQGFDAGASHVTHLFNAMRGYHHRDPGVIGAALVRDDVSVEVIGDGIHVDKATIEMTIRAKGYENVVIVSDATPLAGLPNGEYKFLGLPKIVIEKGKAMLADGTFAGSTLTLDKAIRVLYEMGFPINKIIQMMSANPARILRLSRKGILRVGYDADIVVLNQNFDVTLTIVEGDIVHSTVKL